MARTPTLASGRLEMAYTAYGKPHVFRCWTSDFQTDSGVGTFNTAGTPASLDALATELSAVIKPLYEAGSALAWGAWRGFNVLDTDTGEGVPIVEGTITAGTASFTAATNAPGAPTQGTWSFRDAAGHVVKYVFLGAIYGGSGKFPYSTLPASFQAVADYITGSPRIISRNGLTLAAFINASFDTNDGLQRKYRR